MVRQTKLLKNHWLIQVLEVSSESEFLPGFKAQFNLASLSRNRDLEAKASNAAV